MKNYFDLSGRVAVVTGASTGLGLQMAKAFASQGANLVLLARRMNLLEENAKAINAEFGVEVLPFACDITNTDNVKAAVAATMERFGRVDILMNNAGTGAVAPAEEITDEQFKKELDIDLFGTFNCSREFGKEMIKAGYGRIINIASMYGLVGNLIVGSAPYHAAKGGVVNLTRALAAEWGKHGITVNSICPGYFYTDLTTATLDSDAGHLRALPRLPGFDLCQRPEYCRGRRLHLHLAGVNESRNDRIAKAMRSFFIKDCK